METKELNEALEGLKTDLKGATELEIKTAIDAFEVKHNEAIELMKKEQKESFDLEIKGLKEDAELRQKHLDKLDVKLQNKNSGKTVSAVDEIKSGIQANFKEISAVKKGQSAEFEIKAVGDMTLGNNLTGDQYRDYSFEVAKVPAHKVNFSDLVGVIPISGGTYTFPREAAGEGGIATQTEGASKSQRDYDLTHVDVSTDFIAGFARYSKKMANNVQYLEGFLPGALRRDYLKQESSTFYTALTSAATASTQIITGKNKIEMLMNEFATLEGADFDVTAVAMTPADYWSILQIEKSTGAGYGLPGIVTLDNGVLRINGVALVRANWIAANKYLVGDWNTVKKVVTEGLSVQFSTEDADNFTKNNITARVEAQVGLAVHRPDAIIYGDFTAV